MLTPILLSNLITNYSPHVPINGLYTLLHYSSNSLPMIPQTIISLANPCHLLEISLLTSLTYSLEMDSLCILVEIYRNLEHLKNVLLLFILTRLMTLHRILSISYNLNCNTSYGILVICHVNPEIVMTPNYLL